MTANNEAQYQYTLTTFFDVLGFRDIVANRDAEFINSVLRKLRREATPDDELEKMYEISTIAFSDSVVRSVHLFSKTNLEFPTGLLYHELFNLVWLQGLLIYEDGIFLRGALTAGELYIADGIVFGQALVDAYEMETNRACYPRILVDQSLVKLLSQFPKLLGAHHHQLEDEIKYLNDLTRIDFDGERFIDYLSWSIDDLADFIDLLDKHFRCVAKNAKEHSAEPRVLAKYHWAASYHNAVVSDCPREWFEEFECSPEEFILADKDVPGLSSWPHSAPGKAGAGPRKIAPNALDDAKPK